jgi:hypothetical protein
MKIYSLKSIIFPERNMILVGEYIFIFPEPACYKCFNIPNETTNILYLFIRKYERKIDKKATSPTGNKTRRLQGVVL